MRLSMNGPDIPLPTACRAPRNTTHHQSWQNSPERRYAPGPVLVSSVGPSG